MNSALLFFLRMQWRRFLNFFDLENNTQSDNIDLPFSLAVEGEENLFAQKPNPKPIKTHKNIPIKRFNELDTKILEDLAPTQENQNQYLKLEIKIENTEKEIKLVKEQLNILRLVQCEKDANKIQFLEEKELALISRLEKLKYNYDLLGAAPNLSNKINDLIAASQDKVTRIKQLFDMPIIGQKNQIKNDVKHLMLLQKHLNEISNAKHSPYGEQDENINDYIKFLASANKLNCQITRSINNEINFQKRMRLLVLHYYKKLLKMIRKKLVSINNLDQQKGQFTGL